MQYDVGNHQIKSGGEEVFGTEKRGRREYK